MKRLIYPKCTDSRKYTNTLNREHLCTYADKTNPEVYLFLKSTIIEKNCKFYNTHELDDLITEKYPEWKQLKYPFRVSIILAVLMVDFGFMLWSTRSKKIVYDPKKPECYERS